MSEQIKLKRVNQAEGHPSANVVLEAHRSVGVEGPTPVRVLAQLAQDPGPEPVGFTVLTGEDTTMGLLNSGDAIGIDGRWCPVMRCTSVNGWVTVDTAYGYPVVTAFMDARIHLARVINAEGVGA
ncbi:hypothetical protein KGQ19_46735 [Catenulispora sp. NL8]|uniref:Uncharacterized protein n=1 Tax=Catenulispora pinistramenti TaxID=2705254 RepID=A0ABS5L7N5_9ACTN|nr:hypothetical protein [Catenulispora pinistramenti]MBS2554378.1 hypothetical protein [Catenulispora pinistramenti]